MGLFHTLSEIVGNFGRHLPIFPSPVYLAFLLSVFPLGNTGRHPETGIMGYQAAKKFDDICGRLDTIYQRDRQTGGQTPANSKDRAYT